MSSGSAQKRQWWWACISWICKWGWKHSQICTFSRYQEKNSRLSPSFWLEVRNIYDFKLKEGMIRLKQESTWLPASSFIKGLVEFKHSKSCSLGNTKEN